MKECIVVLGMHRSGTSVMSGLISILGSYTGSSLMKPTEDNPKGYFENNIIYRLNEDILKENNASWDDYNFNLENISSVKIKQYILLAKEIIKDEFKFVKRIVIKDPRFCLLFPIWEKALEELGIKIKVVFVNRSPMEVALSLKKRDEMPVEKGLMLWSHYFLLSEQYSRNYNRFFVQFNEDLYDYKMFCEKLSLFIGNEILSPKSFKLAKEFYSPKLKHQNVSLENISSELPLYLRDIVALLINRDIDNSVLLDEINDEYQHSKNFFLWNEQNLENELLAQEVAFDVKLLEQDEKFRNELQTKEEVYNNRLIEAEKLLQKKEKEFSREKHDFEIKIEQMIAPLKKREMELKAEKIKSDDQLQQLNEVLNIKEDLLFNQKLTLESELEELNVSLIKERKRSEAEKKKLVDKISHLQIGLNKEKEKITKLEDSLIVSEEMLKKSIKNKKLKNRLKKNIYREVTILKFKSLLSIFASTQYKKQIRDKLLIAKSGLFSPYYYLTHNRDVWEAGIDPLNHFINFGWKEKRNPSQYFNCQEYIKKNEDVRKAHINPLLHYIKYGMAEGRLPTSKTSININNAKTNEGKPELENPDNYHILKALQNNLKVAVVVHLFYLDLWDEILQKLNKIQGDYTLYISTTEDLFDEVLKLKKPSVDIKVYKFENVGMDIYPFIQMLNYLREDHVDLFCKLHTKKGNDTTGRLWRENLLEYTIGSNELFSGVVSAFEKDEELKLAGSAFFYKSVEYLSKSYLGEIQSVVKLFSKNKVDLSQSGFFAGTMFWGRVKDFYPFYELLTTEKFRISGNASNKDGALTHITERLFGLAHLQNKKIGIVYSANEDYEYLLEKIDSNRYIKNNITDTIKLLSGYDQDYSTINNLRFFNEEKYKEIFPFLDTHNIDFVHHYLTVGRFMINNDMPNNISNAFGLNKNNVERLLPYSYLSLYGSLFPKKKIKDINTEFEVIRHKAGLAEMHLINWVDERRKNKNKNLVSIVIPAYGQSDLTDSCLKSIVETNAGVQYEIIVVNNSQNESDVALLNRWRGNPRIKIIHNAENLNFALGCNLGFSRSIGSRVVFLNNDTTVTENWLVNLLKPLQNQNVSIAQPRLLYPDGKLQCMGLVFSNKSTLAYPIYQNQDVPDEVLNENRLFAAVTGACLAVRSEDFALVKGFDTSFINGQEDVDFCLKLNQLKNTKAIYVSDSIVFHHEGKSKGRGKFIVNNRMEFVRRYLGGIVPDDVEHYQKDGFIVDHWKLDSDHFRKLRVENYIPKLKKTKSKGVTKDSFFIEENYCIFGNKKINFDKKTILVSAHTVGKEIFGGERSFLDMVSSIDNKKYNIVVTIPNNKNKEYLDLLKDYSVYIYVVPYKMWDRSGLCRELIPVLENIYRINNVDLVYVNTIMCKEPLKAAKNLNIKTVVHVRELIVQDEYLKGLIPEQPIENILTDVVTSCDFLIANSRITFNMFDSSNKEILYNRIDTDVYKSLKNIVVPEKIIFGLISSNIPKKGIFDFVEIAKKCRKKIPNAHFLLIGPQNSQTYKIKRMVGHIGASNIKIFGYIDSPYDAVAKCNVVLSLSHFAESFGRTVGEAFAGGRPVIAYDNGAIPELVEHGKNGFLADYKDINGIVDHIDYLCSNTNKINKMGDYGRQTIANISSPEIYRSKLNKIMDKCIIKQSHENKDKSIIRIVIPIYNAYEEVVNCIDSVLNTTVGLTVKIILIDDASTDERIKKILQIYEKLSSIEVIYNKGNIGYTKTVNIGIGRDNEDVILLNSDTIVTTGWINGLYKTAYSKKSIGTVTAMSDNAGAFSFPREGQENPKVKQMTYNNYAKLITRSTKKLPPIEVPTGSGFCLYIKRELINEIGLFDEILFPRGYGEENDFCMRAIDSGWKNVISTDAFVFHVRTASFGEEKKYLVKEGLACIVDKYPDYNNEVKKAFGSIEMKELREATHSGLDCMRKISENN